jgi:hypothetical protein
MKKLTLIFTILAFVLGIAIISCTKQATQTDPVITTTTDAIVLDNTVSDFTGLLDDYTALNITIFADPTTDPTLKAASADPIPTAALAVDKCAKVTYVKTPVKNANNEVTGATVVFTIDFGTTGCVGIDGKARRGKIVITYTWVKLGGWTRTSTFDMYQSDVHYVGYLTSTYGVTGANNHAYLTEASALTVTEKDGTKKSFNSNRQRELVEGNSPTAIVKIWKITGNSSFTNVKGETSTYTITNPLYRTTACKSGFVAGTIVTVTAGVTTTIEYGAFTTYAAITCKDGFTVTKPGANGGPSVSTFIKFGK